MKEIIILLPWIFNIFFFWVLLYQIITQYTYIEFIDLCKRNYKDPFYYFIYFALFSLPITWICTILFYFS